jgi:hypothetical protein
MNGKQGGEMNASENITIRAKEYVSKYMQELRDVSKSFLEASAGQGKNGARGHLMRLRKLIDRMDYYNFKARDRKFVIEAKGILVPSFEQAIKYFNQGDWFDARQVIQDAMVDTLTIESFTSGWHEAELSGTRAI